MARLDLQKLSLEQVIACLKNHPEVLKTISVRVMARLVECLMTLLCRYLEDNSAEDEQTILGIPLGGVWLGLHTLLQHQDDVSKG